MDETIFSIIRKESDDFFNSSISPVPGYSFNQYEMVKLCHLYRNSKFENGGTYLNRDLLFFNIVNPPCEVATKMLNVDTKNLRLYPLNPKSYYSTYLLEKELKTWLKTSEFGQVLNKIAEEAPVYGSVFLEKTKDGAEVVDIRRLICDQSAEEICDSRFITTIHYMTPSELRETGWDNVDVAIDRFSNTNDAPPFEDQRGDLNKQASSPFIKIYKRYGEVPEYLLGGKSDKMVKSLFIVAGADQQEKNAEGKVVGEKGVVLFSSRWNKKDYPFKSFNYTKVKGRLLGMGVIEMLLDVQIRMNELKNQKRISMEISALHLFQTPDKLIIRNILTDLQSGDMLTSPNGIQPIANEERNLSAFGEEEQSYLNQADKLSFSYEAIRGETPTTGTPLGVVQIANAQAASVFAFKRENLCLFLREFFNELVIPKALEDLSKEHVMRFMGSAQEVAKLDAQCADIMANDYVIEQILNLPYGETLDPAQVDLMKQTYIQAVKKKHGDTRFIQIKDALYDDTEFEFDYIIDNEQEDQQATVSNLGKIIADVATNPTILQNPVTKLLYFKFAEKLGVNRQELEMADSQAQSLPTNPMMQNGQAPGYPNAPVLSGAGQQGQATPVAA